MKIDSSGTSELCEETKNDGYKKIPGSGDIQYVLIKALQEQQQMIDDLQQEIQLLKSQPPPTIKSSR